MKSLILIVTFATSFTLLAQSVQEIDLEVPAVPATAILGNPGMEINSVGNYSALISSITSEIGQGGSNLPTNLALEFSPYYSKSRGDLRIGDYTQPDIYRDLKLSLASKEYTYEGTDQTYNRIGIGARTYLLVGDIPVNSIRYLNHLTQVPGFIMEIHDVIDSLDQPLDRAIIIGMLNSNSTLIPDVQNRNSWADSIMVYLSSRGVPLDNQTQVKQALVQFVSDKRNQLSSDKQVVDNVYNLSERTGSILELNAAISLDFPTSDVAYSQLNRFGLWLAYHYIPKDESRSEVSFIGRFSNYSYDPADMDLDSYYLDIGASVTLPVFSNDIEVSLEYIYRDNLATAAREAKTNLTLSYKLTPQTVLQVTYNQFQGTWEYSNLENPSQMLLGVAYALGAQ